MARAFECEIGQRARGVQQSPRLSGTMTTRVEGTVAAFGQSKTGSWFAHSEDKKLWLDRVEIVKDDGERVLCNLDQSTRVEALAESA